MTSDGLAKIVDFGLAKLATQTRLTRNGTTVGTVAYMSPEQAQGDEVDHRSDIWSLGAVLYEMVTGRPPFKGGHEPAVVYSIVNEQAEPVTALRTGVPMELERIVNKCLEKKRDERYQTTADLIADLRRLQRTLPAGTGPGERSAAAAGDPARKIRWWYWAIPLIVIAMGAAVVFVKPLRKATVREEKSIPQENSIAVLPFVDMSPQHDQEYFCDGMTEELINRLSDIQGLRVPARTSVFMFKGKTDDIRQIGSMLDVRTVLEGSVQEGGKRASDHRSAHQHRRRLSYLV